MPWTLALGMAIIIAVLVGILTTLKRQTLCMEIVVDELEKANETLSRMEEVLVCVHKAMFHDSP